MKKYILMTRSLATMGGEEIYANNKIKYISRLGYKPYVFSYINGAPITRELETAGRYTNKYLKILPFRVPNRIRRQILEDFMSILNSEYDDEIIIESNAPELAYWGELFAKKISAKHIVYLMDEGYDLSERLKAFFDFKYARNELFFNLDKYVYQVITQSMTYDDSHTFDPMITNVVVDKHLDDSDPLISSTYDYVCCCFGRLEKKYVLYAAQSFCDIALKYPDKIFYFLFIGGQNSVNGIDFKKEIEVILTNKSNVILDMRGHVFPINSEVFRHIDIAVATAGCASIMYKNGVTTVAMDCDDGEPIGILGYNTSNNMHRNNETRYELSYYLEEVLIKKTINPQNNIKNCADQSTTYDNFMVAVSNSSSVEEYYDIKTLSDRSAMNSIKTIVLSIVGVDRYNELRRKYKTIITK